MAPTLNWQKEVTYIFRFLEEEHKEHIYINGLDGKRYRLFNDDPSNRMNPTSHPSTSKEYQTIEAELVGEYLRKVTPSEKLYELVYYLPDVEEYLFISYEEYISEYPAENGKYFFIVSVPF